MAEPLAVDPTRLIAAGGKLAELVFPSAPSPIAATGSDAVSAAINETMPGIESLVSDGLPGVTASLKRTATNLSTAADIYTKADQSLGSALKQFGFDSDFQALGANAAGGLGGGAAAMLGGPTAMLGGPAAQALGGPAAGVASQVSQAVGQQVSELSPRVAATVPQVVTLAPQAAQMGQQMSPIVQTISQSAQQAGQGSQGGGAAPAAEHPGDAKPEDEAKKDDEDEEQSNSETLGETSAGAAPAAAQMMGGVPLAGPGGGKPSANSAASPL